MCGMEIFGNDYIYIDNMSNGKTIVIHPSCMITLDDFYKIYDMVNTNE